MLECLPETRDEPQTLQTPAERQRPGNPAHTYSIKDFINSITRHNGNDLSKRSKISVMSYREIHEKLKILNPNRSSASFCTYFSKSSMEPVVQRSDTESLDSRSKTIMTKGVTKPQKQYTTDYTAPTDQSKSKMRPITPSYETQKWFPTIEGKSEGKISAKELQTAFKTYQNKHYTDNVCKFVVRLFDLDKNGGIDIKEFEQLYMSVKKWVTSFNTCDRAKTGFLTESELDLALKQMEINFSPDFVTFLINRCDPVNKKMSLDQFIVTCVQMQKYTEEFRARDEKSDGIIKLKYEDFLELLMKSA